MAANRDRIRVGIVGASMDRGWAALAHIPALRSLPEFEIVAVCTTKQESAEAVARHFGIPLAFADPAALARHPDVDLVVVTVKASGHFAIAKAAIEAGKSIYCEWPIGKNAEETQAIRDLARVKGVRVFCGFQARNAPAFRYIRDLIAEGHIGRVLSADLLSTAGVWGATISAADSYTLDQANGATLLSIWGGHTLDTLTTTLGPFADVAALVTMGRKAVTIVETGEMRPLRSPDDVMLNARLASGATASVHLRGGPLAGTGFRLEIVGTDGMLTVTAEGIFAMVFGELIVKGATGSQGQLLPMQVPRNYCGVTAALLTPQAMAVAETYALVAEDLRNGTALAADIDAGVALHRLLSAAGRAAASGVRESIE